MSDQWMQLRIASYNVIGIIGLPTQYHKFLYDFIFSDLKWLRLKKPLIWNNLKSKTADKNSLVQPRNPQTHISRPLETRNVLWPVLSKFDPVRSYGKERRIRNSTTWNCHRNRVIRTRDRSRPAFWHACFPICPRISCFPRTPLYLRL